MSLALYLVVLFLLLGVYISNTLQKRRFSAACKHADLRKIPSNVVKLHEAWRLKGKGGPDAFWRPEKPAVTPESPNAITFAEQWRQKWFGLGHKDLE